MKHDSFAQVVLDLPVEGPFDYAVPQALAGRIAVGCRVSVSFNNKRQIGFVVGLRSSADVEKVLPVLALPDEDAVFDATHLQWTRWISRHYGCSWGQALAMSLPAGLRRSSRICVAAIDQSSSRASMKTWAAERQPESGVFDQKTLDTGFHGHDRMLIHDPSQKNQWPMIEARIRSVWESGQSVLILVPEIAAFKSGWRDLLREYRRNVFIMDPALKDKDRTAQWLAIRQSSQSIVFGTRSAVFSPVGNPGLMVVADEDHDFYKEEQSPFYHARELVLKKSELTGCPVLFVSVMPSVELWERTSRQGWGLQRQPLEQTGRCEIIDVTNFSQVEGVSVSTPLIKTIDQTLAQKKPIVLFWNRRGYYHVTRCAQCGENVQCPRCETNLILSVERKVLFCGRCGWTEDETDHCPRCHSPMVKSFGRGGEKLAKDLKKLFPSASIARLAADVKDIPSADIIIATQSILRWSSTYHPGLMAVLDYDGELSHPDFRAGQRVFGLLLRLRLMTDHCVIQTRNPSDNILRAAATLDFEKFYAYDLDIRRTLKLPPLGHALEIVVRGLRRESVEEGAMSLFGALESMIRPSWELSGPQPDLYPKLRDKYRFRMILKGPDAEEMISTAKEAIKHIRKSGLIVTINLDP